VTRVDLKMAQGGIYRAIHSDGRRPWFTQLGFGIFGDYTETVKGEKAASGVDIPFDYSGPRQTNLNYNFSPNRDYFAGRTYSNLRHNFSASIRPSGAVSVALSGTIGGTVDFSNARKAHQVRLTPSVELKLGRPLSATLSHNFQRLTVGNARLFTAHLLEARAVYYLSSRTFVRAIAQYTDIERDPSLYLSRVPAETRRLFTQFLFSYKLNPQTVALVGYADNARGDQAIDVTRSDRTFFVKVGYAWLP
jgi:hypothetical protein